MELQLQQLIESYVQAYGIYAIFMLCTIEGDITLLLSGVLAHIELFGKPSWYGFV